MEAQSRHIHIRYIFGGPQQIEYMAKPIGMNLLDTSHIARFKKTPQAFVSERSNHNQYSQRSRV